MGLVLFNTAAREKQEFVPLRPGHVGLYVCGPTVYAAPHIGNARPAVVFDVLVRLLRRNHKVTYVRNITDVDDKINAAASDSGETIGQVTERTTAIYHEDMAALGTLPPDHEPRATEFIPAMIAFIETLIEKGQAYEAEGHVLFDVPGWEAYGELSGRDRDDMIAGARVEVAPYKRDPADFVLWKPSPDDLPGWDSPWGRGRPGWHIECSAMSEALLGETFDIHGGGHDLIFPHHENELAQSRCAHDGAPFARYWMHNGYLNMAGEKMSKSEGNVVTVRELLAAAPGEAIRLALLSGHYRQPLEWSAEGLDKAKAAADGLYTALRRLGHVEAEAGEAPERNIAAVVAALEDDLNTPRALAEIHALARAANTAEDVAEQATAKAALLAAGDLLGLLGQDPEAWFQTAAAGAAAPESAEIDALIEKRIEARERKDFAEADRIRDELAARGVTLEDGPGGTTWRLRA